MAGLKIKHYIRRFARTPRVQRSIAWLLLGYMRLVFSTMRWKILMPRETSKLFEQNQPVLFSFWHGRLLFAAAAWKKYIDHTPVAILVSQHTDGDYSTLFLKHYDINLIRGSTSKGAVAGAKAVLTSLKNGYSVSLTVDGPRGPRMRLNSGISRLATKSEKPIISFCYSAKWAIKAGSWDSMLLPLPFSRGILSFSKPFTPERGLEAKTDSVLEKFMIDQQDECDTEMQREIIYPAPRV